MRAGARQTKAGMRINPYNILVVQNYLRRRRRRRRRVQSSLTRPSLGRNRKPISGSDAGTRVRPPRGCHSRLELFCRCSPSIGGRPTPDIRPTSTFYPLCQMKSVVGQSANVISAHAPRGCSTELIWKMTKSHDD